MADIDVRVHEGPQAVRQLAPLLAAEGLLPPAAFAMDPAYLAAGLEGDCPIILVAHRGTRPVAFMALALRSAKFNYRLGPVSLVSAPYRELRMLGCHCSEEDDGHGHVAYACDALMRFLSGPLRRRFDIAQVAELPVQDPLTRYLMHAPAWLQREMTVDIRSMDSYRVRIEGSFDDYLRSRLRGKTRNTLRRKLRMFSEAMPGSVTVRTYAGPADATPFLSQASRVAQHTYQSRRGYETITDTPQMARKIAYFAQAGCLRSYILFAGDRPCAYCYGIIHRRTYLYEIPGYDERIARHSPGLVLLYRMLEDLFGSGLVDELDFGAGPAEYKRMFATSNPSVGYASLYLRRPYPRLLRGIDRGCSWLTRTVKPWAQRLSRCAPRPDSPAVESDAASRQQDEAPVGSP